MWTLVGSCSQCGDCCNNIIVALFMCGQRDYCRYLDKAGKCKVRAEYEATGQKPKWLPTKHFTYFLEECLLYPDPSREEHCPPIHDLVPGCTYSMVWEE